MFLFLKDISQYQNNLKPLALKGFIVFYCPWIELK